jgi:hypothetical protein
MSKRLLYFGSEMRTGFEGDFDWVDVFDLESQDIGFVTEGLRECEEGMCVLVEAVGEVGGD